MSTFEDLFKEDQRIPLPEAASFFIGIKKFANERPIYTEVAEAGEKTASVKLAEWTDPPDETGTLEGQFNVPIEQVVARLKDVITAKLRKMNAYLIYGESVKGLAHEAIEKVCDMNRWDEEAGAKYYTERAAVLGGPVHIEAVDPPPATTNPVGIVKLMIRAEQEGIQAQRELRAMVGDENPMKVGIEEHMQKDQHHLDELWKVLPEEERVTEPVVDVGGDSEGASALPETPMAEGETGAEEPEEGEEAPAESEEAGEEPSEKEASARMRLSFLKLGSKSDQFKRAMRKLGYDGIGSGVQAAQEGAEMSPPSASAGQPPSKIPAPAVPQANGPALMPTNYLEAELAGQQAQEANEAGFYRERAQQAAQENQQLQMAMEGMQAQLAGLQEQAAQSGAQIQQATQEASVARDDALRQTQMAARMRMGIQKIQQGIIDAASQDPETAATIPTELPPGSGDQAAAAQQAADAELGGEPAPEGGPAGQASAPGAGGGGTPPGTPPAGAGAPGSNGPQQASSGQSGRVVDQSAEPQTQLKTGSIGARMAGAAVGGGLGALKGLSDVRTGAAPYEAKAQSLEAKGEGGFRRAMALAKAKAQAAMGQFAEKHPGAHVGMNALTGAGIGAAIGPDVAKETSRLQYNIGQLSN